MSSRTNGNGGAANMSACMYVFAVALKIIYFQFFILKRVQPRPDSPQLVDCAICNFAVKECLLKHIRWGWSGGDLSHSFVYLSILLHILRQVVVRSNSASLRRRKMRERKKWYPFRSTQLDLIDGLPKWAALRGGLWYSIHLSVVRDPFSGCCCCC